MYLGYSNIRRLKSNEVAGERTINPIANFINGIRTQTGDYIELNPNGHGSIDIDLNVASILALLDGGDDLRHDFKCEINDINKVKCSSGHVYLPDNSVVISSMANTTCHNGYVIYAELAKSGNSIAGTLKYDDNFLGNTLTPGSTDKVQLPIAQTYKPSDNWLLDYYHLGAFVFIDTPYFFLPYYDRTKSQALIHTPSNSPMWTDLSTCQEGE